MIFFHLGCASTSLWGDCAGESYNNPMDGGELYTVGGWPSWGWCATCDPTLGTVGDHCDDDGQFSSWPNFGWWVTLLGMVVDHPGDGWWPYLENGWPSSLIRYISLNIFTFFPFPFSRLWFFGFFETFPIFFPIYSSKTMIFVPKKHVHAIVCLFCS